jgi:tryptophan 2,3-dioxygenase
MSNLFEDGNGTYVVLVNGEGQHSLWPGSILVPAEWQMSFGPESRKACLAYIEERWSNPCMCSGKDRSSEDPAMGLSENHYWTYHSLPALLACKRPLTTSTDEDLFIAVHQICEIAFHQMIIDLERTLQALKGRFEGGALNYGEYTEDAVYFLRRVNKLWRTVNLTMITLEDLRAFAEFRASIGPTSGFQSYQFRRIEIMSGIKTKYWSGGTADSDGRKHVAETRFDEVFGADVDAWLEKYRDHSLKRYADKLASTAELTALVSNPETAPLVRALAAYDRSQLAFHKIHLRVATIQLERVGAKTGTGGSVFETYLAKYEKLCAPLFPQFASAA